MEVQSTKLSSKPNPKRVAAGKLNRQKRRGLTDAGRDILRATALRTKPWLSSTGPRTVAGKLRVAQNGRKRQQGMYSLRQLKVELKQLKSELMACEKTRNSISTKSHIDLT